MLKKKTIDFKSFSTFSIDKSFDSLSIALHWLHLHKNDGPSTAPGRGGDRDAGDALGMLGMLGMRSGGTRHGAESRRVGEGRAGAGLRAARGGIRAPFGPRRFRQ